MPSASSNPNLNTVIPSTKMPSIPFAAKLIKVNSQSHQQNQRIEMFFSVRMLIVHLS